MIKMYFNEKSDATCSLKITIKDLCVTTEVKDPDTQTYGYDVIETMRPYNSYALIRTIGKVKIYRKMSRSDYKFLDLNRIGVSIKMDFAKMIQLYGTCDILQVDTGIIGGGERDIIIRVFEGHPDRTEIESDEKVEILTFNSDDLVVGDHPRNHLWDSYALEVNNNMLMADKRGYPINDDFDPFIAVPEGQDYVEFTIHKYRGSFEGVELKRDIDSDTVFIESTCGVLNTRRVELENGVGAFRLYPLGYSGSFKIKLGRKWYEVWNEYNLIMEESE